MDSSSQDVKYTLSRGVPKTCKAPPLRSTLADELPTPIRARRNLNTAPASIIAVTPWGTDMEEPSGRVAGPPDAPNPIS